VVVRVVLTSVVHVSVPELTKLSDAFVEVLVPAVLVSNGPVMVVVFVSEVDVRVVVLVTEVDVRVIVLVIVLVSEVLVMVVVLVKEVDEAEAGVRVIVLVWVVLVPDVRVMVVVLVTDEDVRVVVLVSEVDVRVMVLVWLPLVSVLELLNGSHTLASEPPLVGPWRRLAPACSTYSATAA